MTNPVIIAIDFETSAPNKYSACALGAVRIECGKIVNEYYSLIRPPSSRIYFTHVHGLTWGHLKNARPFKEVWEEIGRFIAGANFFMAHNAPFDRGILRGCCEHFMLQVPDIPFLCTLKGSRKTLPISSKSLNFVCDYFGIPLNHHHAVSDARACALIFLKLLGMGVKLETMVLDKNKAAGQAQNSRK